MFSKLVNLHANRKPFELYIRKLRELKFIFILVFLKSKLKRLRVVETVLKICKMGQDGVELLYLAEDKPSRFSESSNL